MHVSPLISVVIPTFNAGKYLKPCIDSLISQTEQRFEVIFVDDGSTDDTIEIINSVHSDKFRIVSGKKLGIAAALNVGIQHAIGKFIARMDADDICYPDRFEIQLNEFIKDPDLGLCAGNVDLMGVEWPFWGKDCASHKEYLTRLIWELPICHPSVMWNKQIFIDKNLFYDESFRDTEDFELFSRAVTQIKFKGISKSLIRYRIHPNQSTLKGDKGYANYLKIIDRNFYERSGRHIPVAVQRLFWYDTRIQNNPIFPLVKAFRSIKSLNVLDKRRIRSYIMSRYLKYLADNSIKSRSMNIYFFKVLLAFVI